MSGADPSASVPRPLHLGATVGIVGGGQLGRMLAAVARRMGYEAAVLDPAAAPPAAAFASRVTTADFDDVAAVRTFAAGVDVLTFEFENVSSAALAAAAAVTTVRPSPQVLHVTQDRAREKAFLGGLGLPLAPYRVVATPDALVDAVEAIGTPCLVKTTGFGYDGKGQALIGGAGDAAGWEAAEAVVRSGTAVVEERIDLALELSVLVARSASGAVVTYPAVVNRHVDQVLDLSFTPRWADVAWSAPAAAAAGVVLPRRLGDAARDSAVRVAEALGLVGLCCVECFVTRDGALLVNEVAPRPHNSGHLSIEAAATDQFEQQLRAVCDLPLGSTRLVSPAAMANLLGGPWLTGAPDVAGALALPGVTLHLYGKRDARRGRKMGHLTATAPEVESAIATVEAARRIMRRE